MLKNDKITSEMKDLAEGQIIFDSTGISLQDLAVSNALILKAEE